MKDNRNLFPDSHFVGYVSHVAPSFTKIHLPSSSLLKKFYYDNEALQAGLVGNYLLIEGEDYGFLAQVIEISLPEKERLDLTQSTFEQFNLHPTARVEILLCFNYYDKERKATKGLNQLPPVGSKVFICSTEILQSFLQDFGKNTERNPNEPAFEIANLPDDENATIKLSPQALFSRHCAIVGTTGGGKSYTVAKLLEEITKNNGKAIVIDATGEYERLAKDKRVKYVKFNDGEDSVYFHYSGLRETDLSALFIPGDKVQLPKLQSAYKSLRLHKELTNLKNQGTISADDSIWLSQKNYLKKSDVLRDPAYYTVENKYSHIIDSVNCNFDIKKLAFQVYHECIWESGRPSDDPNKDKSKHFGGKNDTELGHCSSLISRINITLKNSSFIKAFGLDKSENDKNNFTATFEDFINLNNNENLLILSVENVTSDNDLKVVLVNAIGRYLYEKALSPEKPFKTIPLILMLDEAHQFLNKKVKDGYSLEIELNAFEKIAKECRKQGLFLVLATQMPRDIPQGVLSQFGTFIVHRLINQRDREVIEYACSEATKSALSFLPILAPGEAVLAGVDFPMPIILKIKIPANTPNSDTPTIFKGYIKSNTNEAKNVIETMVFGEN